jgi:predicted nucleic acid-binding protein
LTIRVVLADANILYSRTLRDYFLYAAGEGAIEIHWSQRILDEMSRNLRNNLGLSQADTDRLEQLMNDFIDYALITVNPRDLAVAGTVEMDPGDRHVLAAAITAQADILLTDNTAHFPHDWMREHGIELLNAGELLTRLARSFPDQMRGAHEKTVYYSPKPEPEVLATLEKIVGTTTAAVVRRMLIDP